MPSCPSCRRPVALARESCLYCGAPLPAAVAEEARQAARAASGRLPETPAEPAAPPRTLVVIDLERAQPSTLARATSVSSYEATLLARRGGFQLHRVLPPEQAESEAARLAAAGVSALLIPEVEARLHPLRVIGGERTDAGLALRSETGSIEVLRESLLIVVTGRIIRQRQAAAKRVKVATATLEDGWCIHLHRRADPRPLEIEAGSFEPGFAPTGSTQLELRSWLDVLAEGVPRDDAFRQLTPALAPAEAPGPGVLSALDSLRAGPPAPSGRPGAGEPAARPGKDQRLLLDNLAQFRFYSGWRAGVERRRTAPVTGTPAPD